MKKVAKNLMETHPHIAKEWDYKKNGNLSPRDVTYGIHDNEDIWWICPEGHSYQMSVRRRIRNSRSSEKDCPYCTKMNATMPKHKHITNRLTVLESRTSKPGRINLASKYPQIAAEWDYEGNFPSKPEDFDPNSRKQVSWKCPLGHKWKGSICWRVKGYNDCPKCNPRGLNRPVRCIETNQIYASAVTAARSRKVKVKDITACTRKEQETAGGYHWEYVKW